jgi:hypothetical protein
LLDVVSVSASSFGLFAFEQIAIFSIGYKAEWTAGLVWLWRWKTKIPCSRNQTLNVQTVAQSLYWLSYFRHDIIWVIIRKW